MKRQKGRQGGSWSDRRGDAEPSGDGLRQVSGATGAHTCPEPEQEPERDSLC